VDRTLQRREAIRIAPTNMNRYNSIKKVVSLIIGAGFICSSALLVELFFLRSGAPTLAVLVMSSLVIGALGYGIVLERRKFRDQQHQVLEDRLDTVSEINLHVRNVLGVVAFYGIQTKNPYTTRMVSDALVRMEGIMRGVLSRWGLQANYSTWLGSSPDLHSSPTSPKSQPSHTPEASRARIH
jgi:hypothetical protein